MVHSEELLLRIVLALYVFALVGYLVRFVARWSWAGKLATGLAALGLAAHTAMLVLRGVNAGHIPLVSMYEYLAAFAWMVVLAYLVFEWRAGATEGAQVAGGPALILALFLLGYAASLPSNMQQAEDLMPVLRSNWLIFHVSVAVVGYGAAGLASALACLYFAHRIVKTDALFVWITLGFLAIVAIVFLLLGLFEVVSGAVADTVFVAALVLGWVILTQRQRLPARLRKWLTERLPTEAVLDRATNQAVRFAFPFLTLVNVTGAIWAYNAWGRYWGWDPKESWSLITWLVYTFYLHARVRAGWRPPQSNAVVVFGLLTILFTFLGVNKLAVFSSSLHSYASGG